MQKATIRLRLNKLGSDVPIVDATPAEAVLLHVLHQSNNGGRSFGDDMEKIEVNKNEKGEAVDYKVDSSTEYNRLFRKYGGCVTKKGVRIISMLWPDKINMKLPEKFSDIKWENLQFDGEEIAALNLATGAPVKTA